MNRQKPLSTRKTVVRAVLLAVYLGVAAVMLIFGRAHVILIDNKEAEDGSYAAVEEMAVSVNGGESSDYYAGDRDKVTVKGQRHRIKVEVAEGQVIEKVVTVPFGENTVILSVPKMLAGIEPYIEHFTPPIAPPPSDEGQSESFEAPPSPPPAN